MRAEAALAEGKQAEDEARRRRAIELKREQLRRAQEKTGHAGSGLLGGRGRHASGPVRSDAAALGSRAGRGPDGGGRIGGIGLVGDGVLDFAKMVLLDAQRVLQAGAGYKYDGPAVPNRNQGKDQGKGQGKGEDGKARGGPVLGGGPSRLPAEARTVSSVLTCGAGLVDVLGHALGLGSSSAQMESAAEHAAARLTAAASSAGLDLSDLGLSGAGGGAGDGAGAAMGRRQASWRRRQGSSLTLSPMPGGLYCSADGSRPALGRGSRGEARRRGDFLSSYRPGAQAERERRRREGSSGGSGAGRSASPVGAGGEGAPRRAGSSQGRRAAGSSGAAGPGQGTGSGRARANSHGARGNSGVGGAGAMGRLVGGRMAASQLRGARSGAGAGKLSGGLRLARALGAARLGG